MDLQDAINAFLSSSVFSPHEEKLVLTELSEDDLSDEEKKSLEEMRNTPKEDFVVYTNPYVSH